MTNTTLQTIIEQRDTQRRVTHAQAIYKLFNCSKYWLNALVKSGSITEAEAGYIITQTDKWEGTL
jgi:predicted transcriptional regulator